MLLILVSVLGLSLLCYKICITMSTHITQSIMVWNISKLWYNSGKPEPNMLKILLIIPSSTSQKVSYLILKSSPIILLLICFVNLGNMYSSIHSTDKYRMRQNIRGGKLSQLE